MNSKNFFRAMLTVVIMLAVLVSAQAQNPCGVKITSNIGRTGADIKDGQTATIEFQRFPTTVEEFTQTRDLLWEDPAGTAALLIMAYELYRREVVLNGKTKSQQNSNIGWECINMITSSSCNGMDRVKETFSKDYSYSKPWQTAAYLKGATKANGFNPTKPYTIEVRAKKGAQQSSYSNDFQSDWLFLQIMTGGCTDGFRGLTVVKTARPQDAQKSRGKYFIVIEHSTLLTQVMDGKFGVDFKGLDGCIK